MKSSEVRRASQAVHNQLMAFEATARLGSFRAAAEELFVTQGAVAQQIRAMEDKLGMKLFTRMPRGLVPIPAAEEYVSRVRLALGIIEEATRDLLNKEYSRDPNQLTLSTTAAFASRWLVPRLASLTEAYPQISIMVDASEIARPLQGRDGVDMAIRWGAPPFSEGYASFLLPGRAIPVCSPSLRGYGSWKRPEDLVQVPLISDSHNNWQRWFEVYGSPGTRFTSQVFSQTSLVLDAAEQGIGIALIAEPLVEKSLKTGSLVQALGSRYLLDTDAGFYVLTADSFTSDTAIGKVVEWLLAQAAR